MSRYVVLRDCHYAHRYWEEKQIANFAEGVTPPEHFQPITESFHPKEEPIDVPAANTMHEMNVQRKDNTPKTGMGHVPGEEVQPIKKDWEKPNAQLVGKKLAKAK